jgi:hypothetical protein
MDPNDWPLGSPAEVEKWFREQLKDDAAFFDDYFKKKFAHAAIGSQDTADNLHRLRVRLETIDLAVVAGA